MEYKEHKFDSIRDAQRFAHTIWAPTHDGAFSLEVKISSGAHRYYKEFRLRGQTKENALAFLGALEEMSGDEDC